MLEFLSPELRFLPPDVRKKVIEHGKEMTFAVGTEILAEGQYVRLIPLVLEGLIKVYTHYNGKELLLYYIQPQESCIMSFAAGLQQTKSKIYATSSEPTRAILLPVDEVNLWIKQLPDLNLLFFQQYNKRYEELLATINSLLFDSLDARLLNYLKEKAKVKQQQIVKLSHRAIAQELGTAREVVSRLLKRLETEKKLVQQEDGIKLLL